MFFMIFNASSLRKYIQNGYIYFPININDINDFNKKFSLLIEKKKFNKYKKLNYKFHPQSNQIFAYKQKVINKNVQSIFYSSTGSIIQYIQERKNALHVTESSFYEFYNPLIWTHLKAQKVSNNVFHYKLKKGKNIILYGNNLDYRNYIY